MQFTTEDEAVVIVELYGRPTGRSKMYVEVIGAPATRSRFRSRRRRATRQDKFLLSAKLPIAALKPGDYTVRAIVAVEGQPEGAWSPDAAEGEERVVTIACGQA